MRSRRAALMLSLALLAGTVLATQLPTAGAAAPSCPCVLLIEVDGLEPKDVTRETTPFLWELAHPDEGELIEEGRNGWTWQAPRSVMTAGTAANAGALLTGSYPEQHGVPADEFLEDGSQTYRLEHNPLDAQQIISETYESEFLPQTISANAELGKQAAMFVGNPALSGLTNIEGMPNSLKWYPTNTDPENPPSPAYCDVPRNIRQDASTDPDDYASCSASDMVTTNRALDGLNGPDGAKVAFAYIHLAELGVIKRRDGDIAPSDYAEVSEADDAAAAESVPHALAQTDAAIAQFIQRYQDETASPVTGPKWNDTFIFVVGSHGYETAPIVKRLPAPSGAAEPDLEAYVEKSGKLTYSPYGSMATIHASGGNDAEKQRELEAIAVQLKQDGPVETACRALVPQEAGPECIKEVFYLRDGVLPSPTASDAKKVPASWNLDHVNEAGVASRSSGELLVITEPGWGAGRGAPVQQSEGGEEGASQLPVGDNGDPYLGVAGGPRNRAVAAIVNGPGGELGVRDLPEGVDHYPVRTVKDDGAFDPSPSDKAFETVFDANREPSDDTRKVGYERQPETIDFAPTIAALLEVGIESDQLPDETRFLQEAFLRELKFPDLEAPPEPLPLQCADGIDNDGDGNVDLADLGCSSDQDDDESDEPPPPTPEPEVIILPPPPVPDPPPPPKAWSYSGLVRNLSAAVGNRRGRIFPSVSPRSKLDYLILRADFGKPLASVKLSFYKRQRTEQGRAGRRRVVVKTLASFDPFSIKRAKNAKLTLKVPAVFKPTHVGVVVQRARRLSGREAAVARRKKLPLFKSYGARKGGIYRIKNARRMHTIAPQKKRRR